MLKRMICIALAVVSIFVVVAGSALAETPEVVTEAVKYNKYNIMIVLDSSGSLRYTDPNRLRFDAIHYFVDLLAEKGNRLGAVSYSTEVGENGYVPPKEINSNADKREITDLLENREAKGWTNTGEALSCAVELLCNMENGSENELPSIILFFSDGNTEMSTTEETNASTQMKEDAVKKAKENKIGIYSVCLNVNNEADPLEMRQISNASYTNGKNTDEMFREVKKAEDLQGVFDLFYGLIYNTGAIELFDGNVPDRGFEKIPFWIPSIGVEETNIIVYGEVNARVCDPDGRVCDSDGNDARAVFSKRGTYTMIKLTNIPVEKRGKDQIWEIEFNGKPGNLVRINMVFNPNLTVSAEIDQATVIVQPDDFVAYKDDTVKLIGTLYENGVPVEFEAPYEEFSASLVIMDQYGAELETVPMEATGSRFGASKSFDNGNYKFRISVSLKDDRNKLILSKDSEETKPLRVIDKPKEQEEAPPVNTPPTPINDHVFRKVRIWPFVAEPKLEIDMSTLARDAEDSVLTYRIQSASFIEGEDYSIDGNTIVMHHYGLSKGSFEIIAIDSGGLSCLITVEVQIVRIAVLMAIGLAIIALLVIVGIITALIIALGKPFRGRVFVDIIENEVPKGVGRSMQKQRGRIKLSVFKMPQVGIDYRKSYFQASGKDYITLVTNKPVRCSGQSGSKKKNIIRSGADVFIIITEGDPRKLCVRFESKIKTTPKGHKSPRRVPPTGSHGNRAKRPIKR